jgi:predicted ATPase/DNA-binding SARP family transcriptional activator
MPHLTLNLLGAFQVALDGAPVAGFDTDKTRALLAYLAVEPRPHRREALAGLLWPEVPESSARRSLSQALFTLRQAIGDAAAKPPFLLVSRDSLQWNPVADFSLDVAEFHALLAQSKLREAAERYRGDFLRGFVIEDSPAFEEWAALQRGELKRLALEALSALTQQAEQQADFGLGLRYANRQLELDPLREAAHRQKLRLLAAGGQLAAALVHYESFRKTLHAELGVGPSAETQRAFEQIKAGKEEVSRAKEESSFSFSLLPSSLSPLVGRERELAEIARLLADPDCRLLTIAGPGGAGKTRLAMAAARQAQATAIAAFAAGVAFVPLQSVAAPEAIVPAITSALGLSFQGQDDLQSQLLRFLGDKALLLVLDNFEHLLEGATLVLDLLQGAPALKLLVTCREPLAVEGEWVLDVAGLERGASIELFLQRARQTRAGFAPSAAEQADLERICRMVGDVPLALELAASWLRLLSVGEIRQELERGLDVLAANRRDIPERHRSMRAVFDSSWARLSPEEQAVLARLSAFRGGFTREAAERVADASLTQLAGLVSRSLLHRAEGGRYDLHELLRQYAAEKLRAAGGAAAETRARHAEYWALQARRWQKQLEHAAHARAMTEIQTEIDNLRLAWQWGVEQLQPANLRALGAVLSIFFENRGWNQEGLETFAQLERRLEGRAAPDDESRLALGEALLAQGSFAGRLGDNETAQQLMRASVSVLEAQPPSLSLARVWRYLGFQHLGQGEYDETRQCAEQTLALARALDSPVDTAGALGLLGYLSQSLGNYSDASDSFAEAARLNRLAGAVRWLSWSLQGLGLMTNALGRHAEAESYLQESLTISRGLSDELYTANSLNGLGMVKLAQGQPETAAPLFREAAAGFERLEYPWMQAIALGNLGQALLADGRPDEAERVVAESVRVGWRVQATPIVLGTLVNQAEMRAAQGAGRVALEWLAVVLAHPATNQEARQRAERLRERLIVELSPDEVAASAQSALTRSLADVVKAALV